MSDEVTIRDLGQGDVDRMVEIALAAWRPIYTWYQETMGPELFELTTPNCYTDKEEQIRRACAPDSSTQVLVAELEGRIVGFATFHVSPNGMGEIGNNAVDPEIRGRGIAPRMYEEAFARMRAQGMRFVKVGTGGDPAHAPARRAYEKVGFNIVRPTVTYYREL
jgi:ribosomal protein S18 acetylase RimI-like enzyme